MYSLDNESFGFHSLIFADNESNILAEDVKEFGDRIDLAFNLM